MSAQMIRSSGGLLQIGALIVIVGFGGLAADAISSSSNEGELSSAWDVPRGKVRNFGKAPSVPTGELAPELASAIDAAFKDLRTSGWGDEQNRTVRLIAGSDDPRLGWILADIMRFVSDREVSASLLTAAHQLLGIDTALGDHWRVVTDHLIAWKVPAPPDYLSTKRRLFTTVLATWERLFVPGDIDWRHVSWGGVAIDDRPYDQTDRQCNCIPAADNPAVSDAGGAAWLEDDDVVFGIGINDEFRAYPRRIMEVREMVNDTLGGRLLGIPYCTLCGSAQAYLTDETPQGVERPVLRTSGLLIRSNKVMYDVNTFSVFDTFTGRAVTGPLAERGIALRQVSVVTTSWGEWKRAHPKTTVLVESLALGRNFDFRNNRDAGGPIFPIGDADPRLPVQEYVLGVLTVTGKPIAFHVKSAQAALTRGDTIVFENVRVIRDGGGVRAVDTAGKDLGGHQAFWFAWSQFHPDTLLWPDTTE